MEVEIAFDFVAELLDLDALGGRVVGVTDPKDRLTTATMSDS